MPRQSKTSIFLFPYFWLYNCFLATIIMDIAPLISVWSKNSTQPLEAAGFQILKYQKGIFFVPRQSYSFANPIAGLLDLSCSQLLRANEGCCLWKAAFGRSMGLLLGIPNIPAVLLPAWHSTAPLWPYKEQCLYSRGHGRGQEASLLRGRCDRSDLTCSSTRCPHCFPCRKATPACVLQRVGLGSCRVTKWLECKRRQKSLLVEVVQLKSGEKEKATQNCYRHESTDQTHAWRGPPEIPRALGRRIPRFLRQGGPALPFCQPTAQAHFPVFGVRSRGVPSRWMVPLTVLEQRRDSTAGDAVPVTRSGSGIKGRPLCCHGNRNARQR